ncbi:hypothetical protein ACJ41O_006787 [Fusarium nematophilum]
MDPVTALSIAAAAVGFFDFARPLLRDDKSSGNTGRILTTRSFTTASTQLFTYLKAMLARQRPGVVASTSRGMPEEALEQVFHQCGKACAELRDVIEKLMPKAASAKWTRFPQALDTIWRPDEMRQFRTRLDFLRLELTILVLGYISHKLDCGIQGPERKDNQIVEILMVNHADHLSRLTSTMKGIHKIWLNDEEAVKVMPTGIMEAILTLRDGSTKALSTAEFPNGIIGLEDPRNFKLGKMVCIRAEQFDKAADSFFVEFGPIQGKVLDCLHFGHIGDRMDTISQAHNKTFDWIFRRPEASNAPWDNLPEWLEAGAGCYWVNGKAASGKSTLMKFIYSDPRLKQHLHVWSSDLPLVTVSFFFWFLGTSLQKSRLGLLRSLLFDILSARPELMPLVMPELCQKASRLGQNEGKTLSEPTFAEVTRWFRRLSDVTANSYRICILIDGLDEFQGDHRELVDFLLDICSNSSSIKMIVSSRPISDCAQALSSYPNLRLQDLTQGDIRRFAKDLLEEKIETLDGPEWTSIIDEMVEKSSGVFLWVSLVSKSLLAGLEDGENLSDLRSRLSEPPPDIKDLYRHMLNNIPHEDRTQAAQIFMILLINQEGPNGDPFFDPLTPLQVFCALEPWSKALESPIAPRNVSTRQVREAELEQRVRTSCLGLIEVRRTSRASRFSILDSIDESRVKFIHKTAFEFLKDPEVFSTLESLVDSTSFNPYASLFWSCILLAKEDRPVTKILRTSGRSDAMWWRLWPALHLARLAEARGEPLDRKYLVEFDRVYQHHWSTADYWVSNDFYGHHLPTEGHWSRLMLLEEKARIRSESHSTPAHFPFPSSLILTRQVYHSGSVPVALVQEDVLRKLVRFPDGFSLVSVIFSLPSYLPDTLSAQDATVLLELLVYKLLLHGFDGLGSSLCSPQDVSMLRRVFSAGASPNAVPEVLQMNPPCTDQRDFVAGGFSIWVYFVYMLYRHMRASDLKEIETDHLLELITLFLDHGADVKTAVDFKNGEFTPAQMIETIQQLLQVWIDSRSNGRAPVVKEMFDRIHSQMRPGSTAKLQHKRAPEVKFSPEPEPLDRASYGRLLMMNVDASGTWAGIESGPMAYDPERPNGDTEEPIEAPRRRSMREKLGRLWTGSFNFKKPSRK